MQSAQLSTVEKQGIPAASSMVIDSLAIGRGKATTGAPVGISFTASMIGFTVNSGLNCADEPIATTISPDAGSPIS